MLIFFLMFFSVAVLGNLYIYAHGAKVFAGMPTAKICFGVFVAFMTIAMAIGRIVQPRWLSEFLTQISSVWLAFMLYFILILLVIDLVLLADKFLHFLPKAFTGKGLIVAAIVTCIVCIINAAAYINAVNPAVRNVNINIGKQAAGMQSLKAVLVTDIHLGLMIGKPHMERIVSLINAQTPDIVLLAGDMFDGDLAPVKREGSGELFAQIQSKYGVFAVTGNHEYFAGADEATAYLRQNNVTVLRDEAVLVNDAFYIVGRNDVLANRIDVERAEAKDITANINLSLPVILMDHQPKDMKGNKAAGADVQVSGHTHKGQLWPMNFIINKVWEIPYGYRNVDGMHVYVSSGVGTWGPTARTTGRPEIVTLNINFGQNQD